jgi:hypothetical protein
MREQPEVAERRMQVANAVAVLSRAMQQLQLLPRELSTKGQLSSSVLPALGDVAQAAWEQAAPSDGGMSPRQMRRGQSCTSEAAQVAAKGIEMYRGLNISLAMPSAAMAAAAVAVAAASTEESALDTGAQQPTSVLGDTDNNMQSR